MTVDGFMVSTIGFSSKDFAGGGDTGAELDWSAAMGFFSHHMIGFRASRQLAPFCASPAYPEAYVLHPRLPAPSRGFSFEAGA